MESPTSTFALLEQAKGGDEQALSRAFERHRRRLAVLIHYKLSPRTREFCEVEDLVQENCLRAFRDIGNFTYQSPGSFLHWLSAIADHAIIDRTRYQNRERRANAEIPRDLQNICLKALEKDPAGRYATAREMADDLRRYLAGEAVHAEPAAYARLIAGKVGQHLRDLESWRSEQVVSDDENQGLRKRYQRLLERGDAWIMEARRPTLLQATRNLGAWGLGVGAAFLTFFPFPALAGAPAVLIAWSAALPVAWIGVGNWRRGRFRVAIAYLLRFCLLAPIAMLVTVEETGLFAGLGRDWSKLELFHRLKFARLATNAQLWWATLAGLPVCWWLRRFTRAPPGRWRCWQRGWR